MRILHVNERASDLGGVERILHDTAKTLAEEGWSQALLHEAREVLGQGTQRTRR